MIKLSLALLIGVAALFAPNASAAVVDTVVQFNPAAFEAPESIQFDRRGNIYVTLALTGEVRKIAPDGTMTVLLTAADGLDGPTPAAFGVDGQKTEVRSQNRKRLGTERLKPLAYRRACVVRHHS